MAKIVIIGAGSHTFSRNLITDVVSYPELQDATISLMDIDEESSDDAPAADKNPVGMNSIGDLMKIADELGKPVVHQSTGPSADFHLYYVIDGNTRYQYSVFKDKSK